MDCGGPERWAPDLGVAIVRHSPGRRRSEAEIRADLRALLREHHPERFPTISWIRKHGPPDLAGAVHRTGGVSRWSRELRVPPPHGIPWNDELIERELRRICEGRNTWPTRGRVCRRRGPGIASRDLRPPGQPLVG